MYQLETDCRCEFWYKTFLWDNGCQFGEPKFMAFLCNFDISRFGIFRATIMFCTKIHIYNQFPVDTYGHWCQIIITNMYYLILKIFHQLPLVNLVLKFKIGFGAPKPWSISFLLPFSIYTWNLAPENALGAKHFSHGVILGQPTLPHKKTSLIWWSF